MIHFDHPGLRNVYNNKPENMTGFELVKGGQFVVDRAKGAINFWVSGPNINAEVKDMDTLNLMVGKSSKVLTIRGDILPCPHDKMFTLIAKSLPEILITGDQSLTDVLSCKETKDVYYQIAEWKEALAKELAKATKSKHLKGHGKNNKKNIDCN